VRKLTRRETISSIGTVLVGGFLLWLDKGDGWETIKRLVSHKPALIVASVTRPSAAEILSGEKVDIRFDRVVTSRVVWLFDDREPVVGWDEVQHAFVNEPTQAGVRQPHRVDAFFRLGAKYETVGSVIVVAPAPTFHAALRVAGAHVQVITSPEAGNYWHLDGVTLASYAGGKFIETASLRSAIINLAVVADTTGRRYPPDSIRWGSRALRWFTDTADLTRSIKTGATWTVYDFHGKSGEALKLMQPLANFSDSARLQPR